MFGYWQVCTVTTVGDVVTCMAFQNPSILTGSINSKSEKLGPPFLALQHNSKGNLILVESVDSSHVGVVHFCDIWTWHAYFGFYIIDFANSLHLGERN